MLSNKNFSVKLVHCGNKNIVNPKNTINTRNRFLMPMGIFAMANLLKQYEYCVEIVHLDLENASSLGEVLNLSTIDAIGFDCHWIGQSPAVLDSARWIKKRNSSIFIFLGGYSASFFAREILEDYPYIDAVVRGDGEYPLLMLCKTLNLKKHNKTSGMLMTNPLKNVPNLVWKEADGKVVKNPFAYWGTRKEMEKLDFADVRLLRNWEHYRDLSKYWSRFSPINSLPLFFLEIGRGCQYNCTFCGGNARAQICINNRKGQVIRSIDSVISIIKKGISFGYSSFFSCFEFEQSDDWYSELFAKIRKEKINISYGYESWRLPSRRLIHAMAESCEHGIFTISPDSADIDIRKKNKDLRLFYSNRQLENCLDAIGKKQNLRVQLYFAYFLPFDTSVTVFKTMKYIARLFYKYSRFTEIFYMALVPDPGSSIFLYPDQYDIHISVRHFKDYVRAFTSTQDSHPARESSHGFPLLFKPAGMSEPDAANLAKKINLFNHLFSFSHSVCQIMETVKRTDIITEFLQKNDFLFTVTEDNEVTPDTIRSVLFEINRTYLQEDRQIVKLIQREYEEITHKHSKKRGKLNEVKDEGIVIIPEDKKEKLMSAIKKDDQNQQIEFDF